MSLTRANFEAEMIGRCGAVMTQAGKDGTTVDGSNASLNGPARNALVSLGLPPAGFTVADADFSAVESTDELRLFDTAEFYLLRSVEGNLTGVDQAFGQDSYKYSQLRASVSARIESLNQYLRKTYGFGLGRLSAGSMDLGFQAEADDEIADE